MNYTRYGDYRFSGYTGPQHPDKAGVGAAKGRNVGWDISHARRWVPIFDTFARSHDITGHPFPTRGILTAFANQLRWVVFNQSMEQPLFANFMDGTNGWYRVNYNAPSTGTPPSGMSVHALTSGYSFWKQYVPSIAPILNRYLELHSIEQPDTGHYELQILPSFAPYETGKKVTTPA